MLGLALFAFPGRSGGKDLITSPSVAREDRPALHGLSTRLEEILRRAEEQTADHDAEAKAEAERIRKL